MKEFKSPTDRLLREISPRTSGGFSQAALVDAQSKAGVMVVDTERFMDMVQRVLPRLGGADSPPRTETETDAPIFDALTTELGPALQA